MEARRFPPQLFSMFYQSTRSDIKADSLRAVLDGLAPDGGLYVDADLARRPFDWAACLKLNEFDAAAQILGHLLPDFADMPGLVEAAYRGKFENNRIAPLVKCGDDYVLELFHGPTCAFKDVALSMLPQLICAARGALGVRERLLILTATSGDTGKAALEGFCDVEGTSIAVFYPDGGVSDIQRAQMVTQRGGNVHVCAVRGNFDDCQRGVKQCFSALSGAADAVRLSSANSINIGRLAPQVTYYFSAYAQLLSAGEIALGDRVDFIVPTGNFGDILAGYFAKLMGLPVGRLVCASNANNVLYDFLSSGVYDARREFVKSSSPSMDILVSSNLERLLFCAAEGDCARVRAWMDELNATRRYAVDGDTLARIRESFSCGYADEAATRAAIRRVYDETGYICDPHTAVAFSVLRGHKAGGEWHGNKCVVLSTASPFKFPAAVLSALGADAQGDGYALLDALSALSGLPIPASLASLKALPVLHREVIARDMVMPHVDEIIHNGGIFI